LARTDWDQPKHRGLSVFIVKVDSPGLSVVPLRQANGESEFCQEFLDDVVVPADALLGGENDGWTVASRLLVHERNALGGGSVWFSHGAGAGGEGGSSLGRVLASQALQAGTWDDPLVQDAVVDAEVASLIAGPLGRRVTTGMVTGRIPGPAGSILKLFSAMSGLRRSEVQLAVLGESSVAWDPEDRAARAAGLGFLVRQGGSLAGGSDEIQRNIISERVLGLPREFAPDKDLPFAQVRRNEVPTRGNQGA
jgi:alkylation response protein AidB-like acyl-CoA dehydrogenase